jgi:hypothetical protein
MQFSKIAAKGAGFRLMEELGTEPRVYYLPPVNRKYPSPGEKHMNGMGSAGAEGKHMHDMGAMGKGEA